jgi:hypothetical protein
VWIHAWADQRIDLDRIPAYFARNLGQDRREGDDAEGPIGGSRSHRNTGEANEPKQDSDCLQERLYAAIGFRPKSVAA